VNLAEIVSHYAKLGAARPEIEAMQTDPEGLTHLKVAR
jgi:hypothetical protein